MTKPINRFTSAFDDYVCEGDTIVTEIDGFTVHARIVSDEDGSPPDERADGFWPSLDPNDVGYIGNVGEKRFALEMDHAQNVMNAWKNDEWFYCGVVLSIAKDDITLDRHAASLWGIECNYPKHPNAASAPDDFPNAYLTEVANGLLDDALALGRTVLIRLSGSKAKAASELSDALQQAITAMNNTPSFNTGIYDPAKPQRPMTSYRLIPKLEAVLELHGTKPGH